MSSEQITFCVQGSSPDPYFVTFKRSDGLYATCTCGAGAQNKACKHRLNILSGDDTGIVSDNKAYIATVRGWLEGTALARALQAVAEATAEQDAAKKRTDAAKKALDRIMHSG